MKKSEVNKSNSNCVYLNHIYDKKGQICNILTLWKEYTYLLNLPYEEVMGMMTEETERYHSLDFQID